MIREHTSEATVSGDLVKVRFRLESADAPENIEAEVLWAAEIGRQMYRIDNIPFYVYELSCNDIVAAKFEEGVLTFTSIVERGGHSTYRLLLKSAAGIKGERFMDLWGRLESLGCRREVGGGRLVALDVPRESDADGVYKVLEDGASQDVWSFEEAHCGHPL